MKIAYLTSMYPAVSHTFILREVRALRSLGVEVVTFSVRRPDERDILGCEAQQEASSTRWLVPASVSHLASSFGWVTTTRPVLAARTLSTAVLKRGMGAAQRIKWMCYFAEAVMLAQRLVAEEFDHLHCHFGNNGSSTGMLAARLAGIPFSMTCHGSELRKIVKHRLAEKVERASFVACVSQYGKAQLMLACQPEHWDKLLLVRCGVPQPDKRSARPANAPPRILCVGRLSAEKGHLVLLDALAKLRDEGVGFHCTLVGDGPLRLRIEAQVRTMRLGRSVKLAGSLEPDRVAEMYQTADVIVLASFSEGVPVVLMEAMAHGRPVVATRVGGVPELVQDGQHGLVVPPGDAEALACALRRMLDDPEWAISLGRNGSQYVRDHFDVDTSACRLMDLFGRAHRSRATGRAPAEYKPTPCPPRATPQDY